MDRPTSVPVPPNPLAQIKFPEESNFNTNISVLPVDARFDIPTPGSKSTVCWN